MASSLNLTHDQGTTFYRLLTLKSDETTPINLTGYTFRGQCALKFGSSSAFSFSFIVRDQSTNTGEIETRILPEATEPLVLRQATEYLYDIEMESAGGEVTRILQGTITVNPEVTK